MVTCSYNYIFPQRMFPITILQKKSNELDCQIFSARMEIVIKSNKIKDSRKNYIDIFNSLQTFT